MRINGSVIGSTVTSSFINGASGAWSLQNVEIANRQFTWPTNVITNGLKLFLDTSNTNSYPGSGTIWYDLSTNNSNFTLGCTGTSCTNPTFSNNAIKTSFSTTTQNYADCSSVTTTLKNLLYGDHTIEIACKINSLTRGIDLNSAYTTETITGMIIWPGFHSGLYMDNVNLIYNIWNGTTNQQGTGVGITSYVGQNIVINAVRISNTLYIYINGNLIVSANISSTTNYGYNNLRLGTARTDLTVSGNSYTWPSNIDFYTVKLYNIGFDQSQVTQNFNATRTRFGL